jgi:hypothetical protein
MTIQAKEGSIKWVCLAAVHLERVRVRPNGTTQKELASIVINSRDVASRLVHWDGTDGSVGNNFNGKLSLGWAKEHQFGRI